MCLEPVHLPHRGASALESAARHASSVQPQPRSLHLYPSPFPPPSNAVMFAFNKTGEADASSTHYAAYADLCPPLPRPSFPYPMQSCLPSSRPATRTPPGAC